MPGVNHVVEPLFVGGIGILTHEQGGGKGAGLATDVGVAKHNDVSAPHRVLKCSINRLFGLSRTVSAEGVPHTLGF